MICWISTFTRVHQQLHVKLQGCCSVTSNTAAAASVGYVIELRGVLLCLSRDLSVYGLQPLFADSRGDMCTSQGDRHLAAAHCVVAARGSSFPGISQTASSTHCVIIYCTQWHIENRKAKKQRLHSTVNCLTLLGLPLPLLLVCMRVSQAGCWCPLSMRSSR
jgi:hypothetical protein